MSKFKVNEEEFLKALEKASMSAKDSYIITISDRDYKGKKLANITASDGISQAMVTMIVEADEPFRVIVGEELFTIVRTLALLKKEIVFELDGNNISIKAGTSTVQLAVKEEAMSMDVSNIRNEENVIEIQMNSEDFISGIRGAVYPSISFETTREILQDTVCLMPCDCGTNNSLRLISSNGSVAAGTDVEVQTCNDNFNKNKQEKNYLTVSAVTLNKVASRLETTKPTTIFMIPKQLFITNGNDFYIIRPYEKAFPMGIAGMLYNENREYHIKLSARDLKVALDIAVLDSNEKVNKRAIVNLSKNGKVKISSIYKKNNTSLSAIESDGEITIALRTDYVKKIVDVISCDDVIISGTSNVEPIYITSEKNSSLISLVMPINLDTVNKKVKDNKEKEQE